jgi:serralysin
MAIIEGTEGPDVLAGTDESDTIYGYGGDDVLNGRDGIDILYGGAGNDDLEGKSGSDNLYGGDGDDILEGARGFDILDGGAGADVLRGGLDHDRYLNVQADDTIIELVGGGTDTVEAFGWDVRLRAHVENLILGGTNVTGWGNAETNVMDSHSEEGGALYGLAGSDWLTAHRAGIALYGGSGDDVLQGVGATEMHGGSGRDYIRLHDDGDVATGGGGVDTFVLVFNDSDASARHITDFDARTEEISIIDNSGLFEAFGSGPTGAQYFYSGEGAGAVAQTADHYFVFDRSSGALYYDPDGNGATTQIQIAWIELAAGELRGRNIEVQESD